MPVVKQAKHIVQQASEHPDSVVQERLLTISILAIGAITEHADIPQNPVGAELEKGLYSVDQALRETARNNIQKWKKAGATSQIQKGAAKVISGTSMAVTVPLAATSSAVGGLGGAVFGTTVGALRVARFPFFVLGTLMDIYGTGNEIDEEIDKIATSTSRHTRKGIAGGWKTFDPQGVSRTLYRQIRGKKPVVQTPQAAASHRLQQQFLNTRGRQPVAGLPPPYENGEPSDMVRHSRFEEK